MKKNSVLIFFILVSVIMLSSCVKRGKIKFDSREPLSLMPGIEWAVVDEPYVAFRKENTFESVVESEARRGEIYEVTGKTVVVNGNDAPTKTTIWYHFDKGWLDESAVTIYDNKLRAQTAAAALIK